MAPPTVLTTTVDFPSVARQMAKEAVDAFTADHPALAGRVEMEIVGLTGHPATELVEQSRQAALLVLGHRGRGAFASAFLGSVGLSCVLHAHCPVTIVRPTRQARTPPPRRWPQPPRRCEMRTRGQTTVAEVMTTAVVSVPPHAPVPKVASTLSVAAVRAVPVLGDEGELLGVISEADLMAAIAATEPVEHRWWRPRHVHRGVPVARPGARTAGELMSAVLVTIDPDATVAAAARLMREQGVNWLPVVADSRLVGVLGRSDLLAVFFRSDAAIRTVIVEDVLVGALATDPNRVAVDVVDGVVTLTGELDTRIDAEVAVALTSRTEGVVDVVDRLSWQVQDRPDTIPVRSLLF